MSKDIAMPSVGTNTAALQAMFTKSKVEPTAGGGLSFLRFDSKRTGCFLFGQAGEDVTSDVISVDISTWKHGQVQWHQKKCNRRMVAVNREMPEAFEPIEYTDAKGKPQVDESQDARSFEFTFDDGTRGLYEASTLGGRQAIGGIYDQLVTRAESGNPFMFPHVKLSSDSYEHNNWGLVYTPILEAVAWYDEAGNLEGDAPAKLQAPAEEAAAPEQEAAPEQAEESAPEESESAAPPLRRRRKTAA